MANRGQPATFQVENFSKGLNTRFANTEIDASESPDLQNIVFDYKGEIRKRNGFAKTTTAGIGSSQPALDQHLYVRDDGTEIHIVASDTDVYARTSPNGATWASIKTLTDYVIGDATTQFDITNVAGDIYRYTWDSTGTDPKIGTLVVPGKNIIIAAQNFNAANNGTFLVKNVTTNYFDVENASGVAETNKTIGTGSITLPTAGSRWQFLEIDDVLYCGNGINDWFKYDGTTVTDVAAIPHSNIALYHAGRLFVVLSADPGALQYSLANANGGEIEDFASDPQFLFLGLGDGQKIKALKSLNQTIIAFKDESTYEINEVVFSTSDSYWSFKLSDGYYGCTGKDACINVENDIFFFTGRQVRRIGYDANFQGIRTNPVSLSIDDQFESLSDKEQTYMIFHNDVLHVAVAKTDSLADTVYILDKRYEGWSKWKSDNANFRINGFLSDRRNNKLYFSSATAANDRVYTFDTSFSDDGTAINAYWKSKRFDLDAPHLYKRFRWLHVTSRNLAIAGGSDLYYTINILDNAAIRSTVEKNFPISQVTPEGVWGAAQYDLTTWGGSDDTFDDPDFMYNRISLNQKGISIQFQFKNAIIDEDISLQSLTLVYTGKDLKHYSADYTR